MDYTKVNVLISIYGFAAVKRMAESFGKETTTNNPPEPPRTVKGPPLSGGRVWYRTFTVLTSDEKSC